MNEDTELVWSPTDAKAFQYGSFLDKKVLSRSSKETLAHSIRKTPVRESVCLPIFATSPTDKIFIEPADLRPEAEPPVQVPAVDLVRSAILASKDKGESHGTTIYAMDISPASYIIASKQGDKTIRIHRLPPQSPGILQATLKTSFYVQMQERSRDFFVTSHTVLSETRSLIAIAAGFGHTLEIWDWARKKKLQVMESVYRWAVPKRDIYYTTFCPLVCYRQDNDSISVYPVVSPSLHGAPTPKNPPFGPPLLIHLSKAGLPHIPKFPELAVSTTAPILVAAAGPRPPRPGHPPPKHAAMLMAWILPADGTCSPRLWRVILPTQHVELAASLPCGLAVHANIAISIWVPHGVRVIGRPGAWQVEPVPAVHERYVLVWQLDEGMTSVFAIPNQDTLACISPDCRFVAYRQGPGADTPGVAGGGREVCLVVLDALRGGKEVWRTPGRGGGGCQMKGKDCGQLMDLSRVSALAFSRNADKLLVGDAGGSVGVYGIRTAGEGDFDQRLV